MTTDQLEKGKTISRSIESATRSVGHLGSAIVNFARNEKPFIDLEIVSQACGGLMISEIDSDIVFEIFVTLKTQLEQQIKGWEAEFAAL